MTVAFAPPGRAISREILLTALDQRLTTAASVLLRRSPLVGLEPDAPGEASSRLLPHLLERCSPTSATHARWLVLTALRGAFPTPHELVSFARQLDLAEPRTIESGIFEDLIMNPGAGRLDLRMDLVVGGVVVDVDFCARNDVHTGIHRVVRETMPRWHADHGVVAAAWIDEYSAFRALAPREEDRVFRHALAAEPSPDAHYVERLVVPWMSTVVLADVPNADASECLAALAASSGNALTMVGYDMIPITSAETRPQSDAVTFARYLTIVKHAHRVATISRSATTEFAGFASALVAQGLEGPSVQEVRLTEEAAPSSQGRESGSRPRVLCVGSREPHKNQRAVLHAAERLWRAGLDFELELIGGAGWSDAVLAPAIERAKASGRALLDSGRVSDEYLWSALRNADFTVFVSLHEGYGLPLADSLACGTPAITSNFGSQEEIAEGGGCLTVDPRDDDAITDAMRELLTEPETLARLRADAIARPRRTWDTYADELWRFLVTEEGAQ